MESVSKKAAATRAVRKLERARPLKSLDLQDGSRFGTGNLPDNAYEDPLEELENTAKNINNGNYDKTLPVAVVRLCNSLKAHGSQLETKYKDRLDRGFIALRNAARDELVDQITRLHLLEIIELRAMSWKQNENSNNYYRNKIKEYEDSTMSTLIMAPPAQTQALQHSVSSPALAVQPPSVLGQGEVMKSSGRYPKPTRIQGKSGFKDEIVIRNVDSGKVSSGAKDRLVQIMGPGEDNIGRAKQLVEETIMRNASPVREMSAMHGIGSDSSLNSAESEDSLPGQGRNRTGGISRSKSLPGDANLEDYKDYKYTVTFNSEKIIINGTDPDILQAAKLVLEECLESKLKELKAKEMGDSVFTDGPFPADQNSANGNLLKDHGRGDDSVDMWNDCNGHNLARYGTNVNDLLLQPNLTYRATAFTRSRSLLCEATLLSNSSDDNTIKMSTSSDDSEVFTEKPETNKVPVYETVAPVIRPSQSFIPSIPSSPKATSSSSPPPPIVFHQTPALTSPIVKPMAVAPVMTSATVAPITAPVMTSATVAPVAVPAMTSATVAPIAVPVMAAVAPTAAPVMVSTQPIAPVPTQQLVSDSPITDFTGPKGGPSSPLVKSSRMEFPKASPEPCATPPEENAETVDMSQLKKYSRNMLEEYRQSPFCQLEPRDWAEVIKTFPFLARRNSQS